MDKKLYDIVAKLIKDILEKESPQGAKKRSVVLDKNSSFMESLEVDSLLALEIVSKIEKKFGIQLKEEDFVYFDNMENIVNLIDRKRKEKINKDLLKSQKFKAQKSVLPKRVSLKMKNKTVKKSSSKFIGKTR